jgi:hypothetical protein
MKPSFLLHRCSENGFAVTVTGGQPRLLPVRDGAVMPKPLLAALKAYRAAVIAYLAACELCGRDVSDAEDRDRLADPVHCQEFGSRAVRDGNGDFHPESQRCPWKA